jgi:hypothetical protein
MLIIYTILHYGTECLGKNTFDADLLPIWNRGKHQKHTV